MKNLNSWWRNADPLAVCLILGLSIFGLIAIASASSAVAARIGLSSFYFLKRHVVYLLMALMTAFFLSRMSIFQAKIIGVIGCALSLLALLAVIFVGTEIKGARRWLMLWNVSVQPSEFAKAFFLVANAWALSLYAKSDQFKAFVISAALVGLFILLLSLQPDIGMIALLFASWIAQLFVYNLPMYIFICLLFAGLGLFAASYWLLPHVKYRIDSFLNVKDFESYQITKSLQAFGRGGVFGVGPGEGVVKQDLPDSHADFIFSVIGEELGAVMCVVTILAFAMLMRRFCILALDNPEQFRRLTIIGLTTQIAFQSIFNIGMSLRMFPTKGVTLPLVSYGGSSIISTGIAIGFILCCTGRKIARND